MDFKEWLEEYREAKSRSDADWYPNNVQIFEAGQQSKQAEVDKRLSDYQLEVSQVGQSCVKWKEIAEGKQAEIDALRAKIDELEKWAEFHIEDYNLSESKSEHDRGWFNAACQVFKMLKENDNDT